MWPDGRNLLFISQNLGGGVLTEISASDIFKNQWRPDERIDLGSIADQAGTYTTEHHCALV